MEVGEPTSANPGRTFCAGRRATSGSGIACDRGSYSAVAPTVVTLSWQRRHDRIEWRCRAGGPSKSPISSRFASMRKVPKRASGARVDPAGTKPSPPTTRSMPVHPTAIRPRLRCERLAEVLRSPGCRPGFPPPRSWPRTRSAWRLDGCRQGIRWCPSRTERQPPTRQPKARPTATARRWPRSTPNASYWVWRKAARTTRRE